MNASDHTDGRVSSRRSHSASPPRSLEALQKVRELTIPPIPGPCSTYCHTLTLRTGAALAGHKPNLTLTGLACSVSATIHILLRSVAGPRV